MRRNRKRILKLFCSMILCACFIMNMSFIAEAKGIEDGAEEISSNEEGFKYARVIFDTDSTVDSDPEYNGEVDGDGVRLRSAPSTDSTILELMYNRDLVYVDFATSRRVDRTREWLYVRRNKTMTWGWAKDEYIYYYD